jgi:hypothetical protein
MKANKLEDAYIDSSVTISSTDVCMNYPIPTISSTNSSWDGLSCFYPKTTVSPLYTSSANYTYHDFSYKITFFTSDHKIIENGRVVRPLY